MIETFEHRNTSFDEILAFEDGFITPYRKGQWTSFLKKKSPHTKVELGDIIQEISKFIMPVVESIRNDTELYLKWDCKSNKWI